MNYILNILIIFLLRRKFRLRRYQYFRFTNQKSNDVYYFGQDCLLKIVNKEKSVFSHVSLNWLLDDDCQIVKLS